MSGSSDVPVVDLVGTSMSALVHAIPAIVEHTGREVILIGGLAAMCRLAQPYRVTTDLDTVYRRGGSEPAQLELLIANGAKPSGVSGVLVSTPAEPGPLIAMKLQSIMNRGAAKEGTDLLDIIRLSLDPDSGARARTQLGAADLQLRTDAALHARRWFRQHADRSLRLVRAVPEGRDMQLDDLHLVGELLESALRAAGL